MAVHRRGSQRCGAAGRNRQFLQRRPAAVPDGNGIRRCDGVNRCLTLLAAGLSGDGDVAAPAGRGQHIAVQLAVAGPQVIALRHGDEVGVHGGGGDIHLAARQDIVVVRADIEMAQLAGGLVVRHQENVVGNRSLAALGGRVDGLGRHLVRLGDGEGGGAAAVQTQGGDAAQLDEPRRHLAHGGADGVAGLPSVNGVEHQGAVGTLAHGGAGSGPGLEAGDHGAVLHQGVQGAHGVVHVVPFLAGSGHIQNDLRPHRHVPQGVHMVSVGFQIHGQHHLSFPDGRGGGGLRHLLHPQRQGIADGQLAVLDGTNHINARLGVAGGMLGVEVIGIQVDTAGGHPGLVHAGELPDHLQGRSGAVQRLIAEVCGDLDAGLAQHGGAVGAEAHGVIAGVTAAQLALRHHDAHRQAGTGVVKVAVDAGHHPVALGL